jgi:hypothetical protein
LNDHEQLLARLHTLESAAQALASDPAQLATVVETARALLEDFVEHTQLEDRILGDVLLEIDAWVSVRAQQLHEHHEAQRGELRALLLAYERVQPIEEVVRVTLRWIGDVCSDMQHEERDILTSALLHDDLIAVAMESG